MSKRRTLELLSMILPLTFISSAIGQSTSPPTGMSLSDIPPSASKTEDSVPRTREEGVSENARKTILPESPSTSRSPRNQSASPSSRFATLPSSSNQPSRNFQSLSSIPYMIGDTSGGGCGALELGGVAAVLIAHPTYGCSRLNIAENNSPVVADRVYTTYRHFHNASEVDVFSFAPTGGRNTLDINTLTLGMEKRITSDSSLEIRLPINYQLSSDLLISQTTGPVSTLPTNDREYAVGNIGLIFKMSLFEASNLYTSFGTALNLPTAPRVRVRTITNDDNFQVYDPNTRAPVGFPFPFRFNMEALRTNETVNLSPFISSYWHPNDNLFGIGFLQFDLPLNQSQIDATGNSFIGNQQVSAFALSGKIEQQVLLRCNLGLGKWLWKGDRRRLINSCAIMSELHYTTTLNNSDIVGPIAVAPDLGVGVPLLSFGNIANRVDSLNALLGIQTTIGKTNITHGFVAPMRQGADRGYDFEYSLSLNRLF